ncbi:pyridoxamine 5'-phosphate oxidase [Allostella sp. ATCC 35155]|nr:pyridoxamine 5'-phosphate oxidase [Stella sp. ATCC 35155]
MLRTSDVAFSPSVKAAQDRRGSRGHFERRGDWPSEIGDDLAGFLAEATTVYLATASLEGQPYVQHRGGPKGFLRVVDPHTVAFADFAGNRQYVTIGNLDENPRAMLFAMDYETRRRVKLWGTARYVEGDDQLVARLFPEGYAARPERAILFAVSAWDVNCRQHIPQLYPADAVTAAIGALEARIRELEAENALLRRRIPE